jgi:hypothetical protein
VEVNWTKGILNREKANRWLREIAHKMVVSEAKLWLDARRSTNEKQQATTEHQQAKNTHDNYQWSASTSNHPQAFASTHRHLPESI